MLTIDGQGKNGIFSLAAGASLTVSGLTLAHGNATNRGGIFNAGGTLPLNNCTVSGNNAINSRHYPARMALLNEAAMRQRALHSRMSRRAP